MLLEQRTAGIKVGSGAAEREMRNSATSQMVTSCDKHCVDNTPESVNRKHFLANKIWLNGKTSTTTRTILGRLVAP